jgi:hypothetical protein
MKFCAEASLCFPIFICPSPPVIRDGHSPPYPPARNEQINKNQSLLQETDFSTFICPSPPVIIAMDHHSYPPN